MFKRCHPAQPWTQRQPLTRVCEKSSRRGTNPDYRRCFDPDRAARRGITRDRQMELIGRKHWAIAEGYIPSQSSFADPALISHETACILNASDTEAHVRITIFFADREPIGPYRVSVPRGARCICASTI
jgi:hypothetical protein